MVGNYDLQFHTTLVGSTDSPRLQRMFNTVISETQLCLGVLTAADAREDLVDEHRRIAREIRDGNTSGALAVAEEALRRRDRRPEEPAGVPVGESHRQGAATR